MAHTKLRLITDADIPAAIELLTRGYGTPRAFGTIRPRRFWEQAFFCLEQRLLPAGDFPRYGYVIDRDGQLVGIMLLIFSTVWENGTAKIRCNGSSVYIDPAFRLYASLLINKARDYKGVTITNLTPSEHTHGMIEALGYVRYCDGIFVSVPLLSRAPKKASVSVVDVCSKAGVPADQRDRALLLEHASWGCKSLWCVTSDQVYPFVFRLRQVKHVPCAQLVYSRHVDDFARFAQPIGSYLARHTGRLFVLLDANGPIPGLIGKYFAGKAPRYFYGPDRPRLGDLAYTEISMFGV